MLGKSKNITADMTIILIHKYIRVMQFDKIFCRPLEIMFTIDYFVFMFT